MEKAVEIGKLITSYLKDELTDTEAAQLEDWLSASPGRRELFGQLQSSEYVIEKLLMFKSYDEAELLKRIPIGSSEIKGGAPLHSVAVDKEFTSKPLAHRIHFLRTAWFRYAAAILIIVGIGAYLYISQKQRSIPDVVNSVSKRDVPAPSSTHATLTLAGGQQILLDSAAHGLLATQGNVDIRKMNDGRIVYNGKGEAAECNIICLQFRGEVRLQV